MKSNIKFLIAILVAAISLLTTSTTMAQTNIRDLKNATPEQRARFQTNMMKHKLNPDPRQITKIATINLKYAKMFQPILKSSDGPMSKIKQAMALQEQKDKELQMVFTKDQFEKYKEFEQELKSKMMARVKENN